MEGKCKFCDYETEINEITGYCEVCDKSGAYTARHWVGSPEPWQKILHSMAIMTNMILERLPKSM